MSDQNLMLSDSLNELSKLIDLMEEDASNLTAQQAIGDYIAPILGSLLAEIEANRQYVLQAADRANLAILMNEKTFLGEILTSIAEHFATILEELPQDTDPESKLGVAAGEIQDLLATWMSFDIEDEEFDDSDDSDDSDDDDSDDDDSDDESMNELLEHFDSVSSKNEDTESNTEETEVLEGEIVDAES